MTAIEQFWAWFQANEALLRKGADAFPVNEFTRMLAGVGDFGWEIGPGGNGQTFLSISPRFDDDVEIGRAKLLLQSAPKIRHWFFCLFRPPKTGWQLEFQVRSPQGPHSVDGKRWEFLVLRYRDRSYGVLFKPDEACAGIGDDLLHEAASIIVDGELGEELRLRLVSEIAIVEEWQAREKPAVRRLEPGLLRTLITAEASPKN